MAPHEYRFPALLRASSFQPPASSYSAFSYSAFSYSASSYSAGSISADIDPLQRGSRGSLP
jgi:hypothetical protein